MSTRNYSLPIEQTRWHLPGHETDVVFSWDYESGDRMLSLYEQGKDKQWNATKRLDWSVDVDMADQTLMPDYQVPIFASPAWDKMNLARSRT